MGQHNIIELNGKRYDAITGAVLGPSITPAIGPAAHASKRTIDGVIRGSKIAQPTVLIKPNVTSKKPAAHTTQTSVKGPDIRRAPRSHTSVQHHQPQKGRTLMRQAVRKPRAALKPAIKVQPPSEIAPASVKTLARPLAKKLSAANVDPDRMVRAESIPKSTYIRRFQPAHPHRPASQAAHVPSAPTRPMAFAPAHPQYAVPPRAHPASAAPVVRPAAKPIDMFEAAIAHAKSHEQQLPRTTRRRSKAAGLLAGIGAFLVLGGFITYLNMPGIEMQFASMKAGFRAELPEYKPTGYAIKGGVETKDNSIRVSFRSGDSEYTVSQQPSGWNSQTLLENYVTTAAATHQTVQSQGRTIYIWGNNAAWVDGGIRYEVSGNAPLTADDIVKLATSM